MARKRQNSPSNAKSGGDSDAPDKLRLDKWLWYSRLFKTRSIATKLCQDGKVRVNKTLLAKPHYAVQVGDVLTFPKERHIRVIEVVALGERRGPAPEAQALYNDLDPPQPHQREEDKPVENRRVAIREPGSGRPTKRERRRTDQLREPEEF